MPVTTNWSRLRARLNAMKTTLPVAARVGMIESAQDTISVISNAVRAEWSDNNQVGFDIERFVDLIQNIEVLADGRIGILDTNRMGTAADFEAIRGVPGLWHQGTGNADRFGLFVNQVGWLFDQVSELALRRQERWGATEPQWFLIEYGTTGVPGAYDPRPPTLTITTATLDMIPRVFAIVENTVMRMLRSRGVL